MEGERIRILQMLKEGKISVDEALKLLKPLNLRPGAEPADGQKPNG